MRKKFLFVSILLCILFFGCSNNTMGEGKINSQKNAKINTKGKTTNSISTASTPNIKRVNIFVENSGSMFGYFELGNEFSNTIASIITNIQTSGLVSYSNQIHKYFINKGVYEQKCSSSDFIKKITKKSAKIGHIGGTEVSALFDTVLRRTTQGTLTFFISDCILSPGSTDAQQYVNLTKSEIQLLANQASKQNKAIVVYRMLSSFKGTLFGCSDSQKKYITDNRPYFIWVIGEKSIVEQFLMKVPDNLISGGGKIGNVQNRYVFFKIPSSRPKYCVRYISKGNIVNATSVDKAKIDGDSKILRIKIAVDLSSVKLLDKYLINPCNYYTNKKFYTIEKIEKKAGAGTTHVITICTKTKVSPTTLTITLKNKLPDWVETYSIPYNQCSQVFTQLQKTYALQDVLSGIYSGYNQTNNIMSISININ